MERNSNGKSSIINDDDYHLHFLLTTDNFSDNSGNENQYPDNESSDEGNSFWEGWKSNNDYIMTVFEYFLLKKNFKAFKLSQLTQLKKLLGLNFLKFIQLLVR